MATENTTEDLEDAVLDSAVEGISSVTVDGLTVQQQRLKDRLDVLDRRNNTAASAQPHFGMRTTRLISPGGGNT